MTGLIEFDITLLLTIDQFLYDSSLTKLFSAFTKQNAAIKTANDACLLLAK